MSHENKELFVRPQQLHAVDGGKVFPRETTDRFVSVRNDVASLSSAAQRLYPDVLLLDLFVLGGDAVTVIKEVKQKMGQMAPRFVVLCDFYSIRLERELYGVGAWMVMKKPVCVETLFNVLCSSCESSLKSPVSGEGVYGKTVDHRQLEMIVTDIMHQVGVPAHIKGYQYTRFAIMLTLERPELLDGVTTRMYPLIAEKYGSTPSRVERAIRHAIEMAWERGNVNVINAYFGFTIANGRGKPTNSEFIAMIADNLRLASFSAS